ncbi:restriction endonuclease [Armatimonas rosea]|uniref:Restriction endonuclease Mrr n=1 Tax=Armatimonas rosea TaxID=685828 RepID=A0A7W9WA39_ARMRO|nr:restriction endonuclease [Armatimonas rosea]MBB6053941.1 restriction endonuclease Mrr [Armatimonas rosea]
MNLPIPNKLQQRLLRLPFDAYLRLLSLLLTRLGYQDVQLAGRTDWKGRNKGGGYDLTATLPGGLYPRRIVIQAKQFDKDSRIFQRHADELRGAAIRVSAAEAVLITSGPISKSIDAVGLCLPILPIRLMGGEQLLELLVKHQIGVTPSGELDEALFKELEREAKGNRQSDCIGSSELLLTVALKHVPKKRL